jgi:hypothetical protein
MSSPLDSIVSASEVESPDLPRLTVANTFIHYMRLCAALERASEICKRIPESNPQNCTDALKDLVKTCESAIKTATRLLEANR